MNPAVWVKDAQSRMARWIAGVPPWSRGFAGMGSFEALGRAVDALAFALSPLQAGASRAFGVFARFLTCALKRVAVSTRPVGAAANPRGRRRIVVVPTRRGQAVIGKRSTPLYPLGGGVARAGRRLDVCAVERAVDALSAGSGQPDLPSRERSRRGVKGSLGVRIGRAGRWRPVVPVGPRAGGGLTLRPAVVGRD